MPYRTVCLLVALAAACGTASANTDNTRPRLIDFNPWAWLPTSRNRSPSIMDYFFPPSRTPKNSNLQNPSEKPSLPTTISQPKLSTTLDNTPTATTIEERLTTRKSLSTATKSKPTVTATYATATTPPKTKKTTYKTTPAPETTVELKTISTEKASSMLVKEVTATTERPTKHYTIKPIRTTEIPTVEDTETTSDSERESTETLSDTDSTMTTAAAAESVKETFPTTSAALDGRSTDPATGSTTPSESSTQSDTTAADGADSREGYLPLRDKPQQTHVKINDQTKKETVPLPAGSTSVLAKPTKYHYYPHNQHIYLLPECAIQQVCNAVYVRLNYTQPLCACPSRYRDPCSASLNADDLHTTRLTTDSKKKYATKAITLVKTCEAVSEMRECRAPRDWSLLALQNIRTGKSHYLVICRCPEHHILEGPMSHDQPTYASVPGIRVYGMMCVRPTSPSFHSGYNANRFPSSPSVQSTTGAYAQPHSYTDKPSTYNRYPTHSYVGPSYYNRMSRGSRVRRTSDGYPPIPWYKVKEFAHSLEWTE